MLTTAQIETLTRSLWLRYATNDNGSGPAKIDHASFEDAIKKAVNVVEQVEGTRTRDVSICDVGQGGYDWLISKGPDGREYA